MYSLIKRRTVGVLLYLILILLASNLIREIHNYTHFTSIFNKSRNIDNEVPYRLFNPDDNLNDYYLERDGVSNLILNLDFSKVSSLPSPGTPGHVSSDLKSQFSSLNMITDNYGDTIEDKFSNFVKELLLYGNDLLDTNGISRSDEYYMLLGNYYKSLLFKDIYVTSESKYQFYKYNFYATTDTGYQCYVSFYYLYSKITDESEDYFTPNLKINHTVFSSPKCRPIKRGGL